MAELVGISRVQRCWQFVRVAARGEMLLLQFDWDTRTSDRTWDRKTGRTFRKLSTAGAAPASLMVQATTTSSAHDTGGPNLDCGVLAMVHAWTEGEHPASAKIWGSPESICQVVGARMYP